MPTPSPAPPPADWLPLLLEAEPIGLLSPSRAARVCTLAPDFRVEAGSEGQVLRWQAPAGVEARSLRMQTLAAQLREAGAITGWRDELYRCEGLPRTAERAEPLFRLERAAFRFFGLRSRAVHVNGLLPDGRLWCGRRALSKATDPGRLDNLAAGGLGADEDPLDCARRELWEEAGVPAALCAGLCWQGLVHARRVEAEGLHDELLHVYGLLLPADFRPLNRDGEVSEFLALTRAEALARRAEFSEDAAAALSCAFGGGGRT